MDKKTDLSAEFGRSPNIDREFFPAAEPPTDLSGEFSATAAEQEYHDSSRPALEFSGQPSLPAARAPSRRKKHRRALLMQMAAAALSVVVVTSAFGEDPLGSDALFAPAVSSPAPETPGAVQELGPYSSLSLLLSDGQQVFLVEGGRLTDVQADLTGAAYDLQTNTLTLQASSLDTIRAQNMGDSFTIYLDGACAAGQIAVTGGVIPSSLRLTGSNGGSLLLNSDSAYGTGLWLDGGGKEAVLTVEWGIDLEIYGSQQAVLLSDTTAENPFVYDDYSMFPSGDLIRQAQAQSPEGPVSGWVISNSFRDTEPGTHVYISSGRGGP